jgi:protein-S-isoprenylcysteine O-methyltransferase Ste14
MAPIFFANHTDAFILIAVSLLWIVPEMILTRSRRPDSAAVVQDRFSGRLLFLSIWLGVSAGWMAAYAAPGFAIHADRTLIFAVGIGLMLLGLALRWYSIHVLGRYFTVVVAVQPGHTIVENGPYRFGRHPSYSGALLTVLGFGLVFTNWLSLAGALFFPALGYYYRIAVEEKALATALGEPYREYMKRTKRIIPFVI